MGVLIVSQEGRQFRRCVGVRVSDGIGAFRRLRGIRRTAVGIPHTGRDPRGGGVARGLVERNAGAAFLRIEGGFERRGQYRLFVVRMVARSAFAKDLPADIEAVRFLHAAPVIGGGRTPVILEPDPEAPAGGLNHLIGVALDGKLRFEGRGNAPGKKPLFLLK